MPQNYVSHVYNYVLHTFAMHLEFMVKGHKAIMSFNTYLIAVVILCQRSQILNCPFCTIEVGQRPWLFIYQVNFSFIFSINPFWSLYARSVHGLLLPDSEVFVCRPNPGSLDFLSDYQCKWFAKLINRKILHFYKKSTFKFIPDILNIDPILSVFGISYTDNYEPIYINCNNVIIKKILTDLVCWMSNLQVCFTGSSCWIY